MAATPPPQPEPFGIWVLIWLGGVASFRLIYSSWHSHVSVRKNRSIWLSDIKSFTNTALEDRDLIFNSPHLIFLFCSVIAVVVLIPISLSPSPAPLSYCCYVRQTNGQTRPARQIAMTGRGITVRVSDVFWSNTSAISSRSRQKGLQYAVEGYIQMFDFVVNWRKIKLGSSKTQHNSS